MSVPPQRRSLMPVRSEPRAPIAEETVAAIATRNGFQTVEPSDTAAINTTGRAIQAEPTPAAASSMRRKRQPTGRDHQFNTRLRRDTLDYIYAEANERNIPIAQVIEEGMEALKRSRA